MTEPAELGGAGSDPSMMITTCRRDGNHWVVNGKKRFITGARASVGIVMARSEEEDSAGGACMFLVDLPDPAIRIDDVPNTIDTSMPGGHAGDDRQSARARRPDAGPGGRGFKYAQVRLSPRGCRTACAGWAAASARTRSPAIMPTAAWLSASN
jgi:acyl-CoA dehydrogenase